MFGKQNALRQVFASQSGPRGRVPHVLTTPPSIYAPSPHTASAHPFTPAGSLACQETQFQRVQHVSTPSAVTQSSERPSHECPALHLAEVLHDTRLDGNRVEAALLARDERLVKQREHGPLIFHARR